MTNRWFTWLRMWRPRSPWVAVGGVMLWLGTAWGNQPPPARGDWRQRIEEQLQVSLAELARVRQAIADEKIPRAKALSAAEAELTEARRQYEELKRQLDRRNLDLGQARNEVNAREQEKSYVSSLLGEFVRNFEIRLHIAELARYQPLIESAKLAPEKADLKPQEVFAEQIKLVEASMQRLEDLLGGDRFEGQAAGEDGVVRKGRFVLLGPTAYFASDDGVLSGLAEQRLGSLEPSVAPYGDPAFAGLTRAFVQEGEGLLPFDPSLGNARKIEQTRESLGEHIKKGGPVMVPILGLAALVVVVSLTKWFLLSLVRMPTTQRVTALLRAVRRRDRDAAEKVARTMRGPAAAMLRAGIEHFDAPKELIEEVMFEKLLETRYRLNKALPLISVSAACAPLLGLLGTVTGIIGTFKLITVFGSGDVKMLSAGISEALITTEFGLCVAIPSLVAHAFLSRKAKAIVDAMERLAIAFMTEVEKGRLEPVEEAS